MNLLIFSHNAVWKGAKGGTELSAYRMACYLKDHTSWNFYNVFEEGEENFNGTALQPFSKSFRISASDFVEQLKLFITENKIDIIINEGDIFRHEKIITASRSNEKIKVVMIHHLAYGSEMIQSRLRWMLRYFMDGNYIKNLARIIGYPLFYIRKRKRLRDNFLKVVKLSDKTLLLSQFNIDAIDDSRIKIYLGRTGVMANIIPSSSLTSLPHKKKRILILSRLNEDQKRISLALKIWKKIEKSGKFHEWHLDIVGDGPDCKRYKAFVARNRLKNINFHGWCKPDVFYKESAILMLTSRYEGLVMTVPEAQGYGCVPIAFNSFPSAPELIKNGETGILIDRFGDINDFTRHLEELMLNEPLRENMALNAVESVKKYSAEVIGPQWIKLLENLHGNNL